MVAVLVEYIRSLNQFLIEVEVIKLMLSHVKDLFITLHVHFKKESNKTFKFIRLELTEVTSVIFS